MVDSDTDRNVFQGPGILKQVLHPFVPRHWGKKKKDPLPCLTNPTLSLTDTLGKFWDISYLSFLMLPYLHSTKGIEKKERERFLLWEIALELSLIS